MSVVRDVVLKLFSYHRLLKVYARSMTYSYLLKGKSRGVKVYGRVTIEYLAQCEFGSGITLNEGVYLNGRGGISVGDGVRFSAGCKVISTALEPLGGHVNGCVEIGNRVWIGAGAIVLSGVSIADDCVVGAGAVVNRSCVIPGSVVVGVPAKSVRAKT